MASSQVEVEVESDDLKYLEFVRILAQISAMMVSNLYDDAKQSSGPLKSTVETVEKAVTLVIDPIYERFKGVPADLLAFLDKKVEEATYKFDECAPPAAKKAISKAQSFCKKGSKVVRDLGEEAKVGGPFAAICRAGTISKQIAVNQLALFWFNANRHPALRGTSQAAAHLSEKYNNVVKDMATRGYSFFDYVPLVPVEELVEAYKQVELAARRKIDTSESK